MGTPDETWEAAFATLERLRAAWPPGDWTYDRRLKCVVSSIPMASANAALAAMAEAFPGSWTSDTVKTAPAGVQLVNDGSGGLRAAQKLFWGGEPDGPGPFGLWWPWGDGTTVSLRIGLHGVDVPKARYPKLRDVFGIPQAPGSA